MGSTKPKQVSTEKSGLYVLLHNSPNVFTSKYYTTLDKAQAALKTIANDRRHRLGVVVIDDTDMKFSFLFGWEEAKVEFSIVELPIDKE